MPVQVRNLLIFLSLVAFLGLSKDFLQFQTAVGGVIIALTLYFQAESLRNSVLFGLIGLPEIDSMQDIFNSRRHLLSFLVRKSMWVVIPVTYMLLNPRTNLGDLDLLPGAWALKELVPAILLLLFSGLMFYDAKGMGITLPQYLRSFAVALVAAGFPEDLMVLGLVGGRVLNLMLTFSSALWARILTVAIVESLFCLSHIPAVRRARKLYSQQMTGGPNLSYRRMFLQMFLASLPGWVFHFLSSHIYFSVWWHTLTDIALFLPKKPESAGETQV